MNDLDTTSMLFRLNSKGIKLNKNNSCEIKKWTLEFSGKVIPCPEVDACPDKVKKEFGIAI